MAPGPVVTRMREIAAKLSAQGVRAVVDPRDVLPPSVLVGVPSLRPDTTCSQLAVWPLYLVAGGSGGLASAVATEEMLSAVLAVFPAYLDAEAGAFQLGAGTDPLPAYTVRVEEALPWP